MNWQDIYKKYKDTELMNSFRKYYKSEYEKKNDCMEDMAVIRIFINRSTIKDIWGYLIVFAETKHWMINIVKSSHGDKDCCITQIDCEVFTIREEGLEHYPSPRMENYEKAMLWCADKFFEVAK